MDNNIEALEEDENMGQLIAISDNRSDEEYLPKMEDKVFTT